MKKSLLFAALIVAALPPSLSAQTNLYVSGTASTGNFVSWTTGALTGYSGFTASDYIAITPCATFTSSKEIPSVAQVTGLAYYNSSHVFIAGDATDVPAGGSRAVPFNQAIAYIRITLNAGDTSTESFTVATGSCGSGGSTSGGGQLFVPGTVTADNYVNWATGALGTASGFSASDYIAITACATWVTSKAIAAEGGVSGVAYYTSSHTYVAGDESGLSAGASRDTPFNSTIAFVRITLNSSDVSAESFTITPAVCPTSGGSTPVAPTLSVNSIAAHLTTDAPFTVGYTSNSGGAVTWSILSGPATVSGSTVTLTGTAGTVSVQAAQAAVSGAFTSGTASASFTVSAPAPSGVLTGGSFASITHVNITDGSGHLLASGKDCFGPVNGKGVPITATFNYGGVTGTIVKTPACGTITNGTLQSSFQLVKSTVTQPSPLCYRETILDADGNQIIGVNDGFPCIQVSTSPLEISTIPPSLPNVVPQIVGAVGPQGTPGINANASSVNASGAAHRLINDVLLGGQPTEIFDPTVYTEGYLQADGTINTMYNPNFYTSGLMNVAGASTVISNQAIGYSSSVYTVFYGGDMTILTPVSSTVYSANTPITVPVGAVWMRATFNNQPSNSSWAKTMVVWGSTVPPIFQPYSQSNHLFPFLGQRALVIGDSITFNSNYAWPLAVLRDYHRMNYSAAVYPQTINQRGAWVSGTSYNLNDLVYVGGVYYSSLVASNTSNPATTPASWSNAALNAEVTAYPGHGTNDAFLDFTVNVAANPSGPTVLQQFTTALSNKDLLICFMGTNDGSTTLGSPGDSASTATVYGYLENFAQTALQAVAATGRQVRIVFVGPYHQTNISETTTTKLSQWYAAASFVSGEYGIPLINLASTLNVNSYNWAQTTIVETDTSKHIHVNSLGYLYLSNAIERQLGIFAQQ